MFAKPFVLLNPHPAILNGLHYSWCVMYVRFPELFDTARSQSSVLGVDVFDDGMGAGIRFNPGYDLEEAWLLLDEALTDAARFIETFQHALD